MREVNENMNQVIKNHDCEYMTEKDKIYPFG